MNKEDILLRRLGENDTVTPRVQRFKRGNPWLVSDEEIDKMRHEYLMEKYQ